MSEKEKMNEELAFVNVLKSATLFQLIMALKEKASKEMNMTFHFTFSSNQEEDKK